MPRPNEHVVKIGRRSYSEYRRDNDKFDPGTDVLWGIFDLDGAAQSEVASIHFDTDRFTTAQAEQWLKDHHYEDYELEPAADDSPSQESRLIRPSTDFRFIDAPIMTLQRGKRSSKLPEGYLKVISFASTEERDSYGTIITRAAIVDAWPGYMSNSPVGQPDIKQGPLRYMHDPTRACGYCREYRVVDQGVLAVDTIPNLTALQRDTQAEILDGVLTGTSIGFNPLRIEKRDKQTYITRIELPERSVVDAPSNPGCGFRELQERAKRILGPSPAYWPVGLDLAGTHHRQPRSIHLMDERGFLTRLKDFITGVEKEFEQPESVPTERRATEPGAEAATIAPDQPVQSEADPQTLGALKAAVDVTQSDLTTVRKELLEIKSDFEWFRRWREGELKDFTAYFKDELAKVKTELAKIDGALNGYKAEAETMKGALVKFGTEARGSIQGFQPPPVATSQPQPSPVAGLARDTKSHNPISFYDRYSARVADDDAIEIGVG